MVFEDFVFALRRFINTRFGGNSLKKNPIKSFVKKNSLKCGVIALITPTLYSMGPEKKLSLSANTSQVHGQRSSWRPSKIRNFHYKHVPQEMIIKFKSPMTRDEVENYLKPHSAVIAHQYSSSGAYLVRLLKSEVSLVAQALADENMVDYIEANTIISLDTRLAHGNSTTQGRSVNGTGHDRPSDERLGFRNAVEQNAQLIPNDFQFGDLWGLHNTGQNQGLADADIDAPEAWQITTGSKDVVTAVIDTGIDYRHSDLSGNAWKNPGESGLDANGKPRESNGIDDDGNGFVDDFRGWDFVSNDNDPSDDHGHGSHCAGVIGAVGNNEKGVTGINWNTSLVGIKFLDASGSGSLDHAVLAIEYATKLGVHLTSNSWGGGGFSETMFAAIKQAGDKGILFVAAAGNDGFNNDLNPTYPASYPSDNIVSVAAVDSMDRLAKFSNFGAKTVHLGAPGVDIISTVPPQKYMAMSVTSMATPHVAGVVALTKSLYPEESYEKIRHRILFSSEVLPATLTHTISGGRLNAFAALKRDEIPPAQVSKVTISKLELNGFELTFEPVGDDGLMGKARSYEIVYTIENSSKKSNQSPEETKRFIVHSAALEITADPIKVQLKGIPFESTGTVKVRAFDSVGNSGEFSDATPFELPAVYTFYENNATSLADTQAEAPWGMEKISPDTSDASSFSDSPGKDYRNNVKTSLTLKKITLPSTNTTFLTMKADVSLEENFDFVYTEVSFDQGGTWQRIGTVTGRHEWTEFTYELPPIPSQSKELLVRLRLESDYSVADDGIKVDEIKLFTKKEAF